MAKSKVKEARPSFTPDFGGQTQGEGSPAFLHPWFWWPKSKVKEAGLPSPLILVAKRKVKAAQPSFTLGSGGQSKVKEPASFTPDSGGQTQGEGSPAFLHFWLWWPKAR